jgi:hypothetical protein
MKLYVYCLVEGIDQLDEPVSGLHGAPVRLLKIEELAVLISDLDADAVPVTKENALDHAAVVRSVFHRTTPLPFRFGTLVSEQQLRSYIAARKPALDAKLAHVRDSVEMSVKIICDPSPEAEVTERDSDKPEGMGAKFLAEKRREILGNEYRATEAQKLSTWLHETVSGLTRDEQVTLRSTERVFLAAAHLVKRSKIEQYRKKLTDSRVKRPELRFLLSGPWPPYSFANIELEFKTQFGVI